MGKQTRTRTDKRESGRARRGRWARQNAGQCNGGMDASMISVTAEIDTIDALSHAQTHTHLFLDPVQMGGVFCDVFGHLLKARATDQQ